MSVLHRWSRVLGSIRSMSDDTSSDSMQLRFYQILLDIFTIWFIRMQLQYPLLHHLPVMMIRSLV